MNCMTCGLSHTVHDNGHGRSLLACFSVGCLPNYNALRRGLYKTMTLVHIEWLRFAAKKYCADNKFCGLND